MLLLFLRSLVLTSVLLHQQTEAFLEKLFGRQSGCECACRTVTVRRCIETFSNKCQAHQQREDCYRQRLLTERNVTETECQVCRHIQETEMVDSFKW